MSEIIERKWQALVAAKATGEQKKIDHARAAYIAVTRIRAYPKPT